MARIGCPSNSLERYLSSRGHRTARRSGLPLAKPPSIVLLYLNDDVYLCLTGALSPCDH